MKLVDKRIQDRPREKLASQGASHLSNVELLMAIIGSGTAQADVTQIARVVEKLLYEKSSDLQYSDLRSIKSLGPAKAALIMAGFEFWRRHFEVNDMPIIDSAEKAIEQLRDIRDKKQEYFVCLTLDGGNRLIAKRIITIGTLTSSLIHPREVFADAITDRAASIIVAHNHPSGSLTPSTADLEVTNRLHESAQLFGIRLLEHIVITKTEYNVIHV